MSACRTILSLIGWIICIVVGGLAILIVASIISEKRCDHRRQREAAEWSHAIDALPAPVRREAVIELLEYRGVHHWNSGPPAPEYAQKGELDGIEVQLSFEGGCYERIEFHFDRNNVMISYNMYKYDPAL